MRVSIATQINSIRHPVELSCVGEVSIATRRRNSTQLDVELSCVAINGPLGAECGLGRGDRNTLEHAVQ